MKILKVILGASFQRGSTTHLSAKDRARTRSLRRHFQEACATRASFRSAGSGVWVHGGIRMSQNEEVFTAEERRELAVKAVNRLIADAEESASFRRYVVPDERLRENKELAEIIAVCIRETALPQLQTLQRLLGQQGEDRGPKAFSLVQDSPNFIRPLTHAAVSSVEPSNGQLPRSS